MLLRFVFVLARTIPINYALIFFAAVRHDRMRGGRNKFGPMYKRDRARKLQVLRTRQATVVPSGVGGINIYTPGGNTTPASTSSIGGSNQAPIYTSQLHIKQEIQIPQVTSMTSSPDSSPSPVQLPHGLTMSATNGGLAGQGPVLAQQTDPTTGGIQWQISTSPNSGSNRVRLLSFSYLARTCPKITTKHFRF